MRQRYISCQLILRPWLWGILVCIGVFWNGPHHARAMEWQTVVKVFDGDTIVLEDGTRVRYLGINTPEIAYKDARAEYFGDDAREANKRLVWRKKVRLEYDGEKKDRFGRVLAYVFLEDNTFVNQLLVEKGCAYVFYHPLNTRYWDRLLQAQKKAIDRDVGMWPFVKSISGKFTGNRSSKRFHHPTCRYATRLHQKNKVSFSSLIHGFRTGFSPCKACVHLNRGSG